MIILGPPLCRCDCSVSTELKFLIAFFDLSGELIIRRGLLALSRKHHVEVILIRFSWFSILEELLEVESVCVLQVKC